MIIWNELEFKLLRKLYFLPEKITSNSKKFWPNEKGCFYESSYLCTYQYYAGTGEGGGGRGREWGEDLIVFVGPGVGHLTDRVLPGEGIFESFFTRRGDIWLLTLTKKTETEHNYVSHFHTSCIRRTVWKDLEIMEANENKRKLSGFHCFVFKFRIMCFSVFLINWTS